MQYGPEAFNLSGVNKDHLDIPPRRFTLLNDDQMDKLISGPSDTLGVKSADGMSYHRCRRVFITCIAFCLGML